MDSRFWILPRSEGATMEAGYKRLDIYRLAHSLALRIHKMTLTLPKFETYEEGGQVRRSSKSVTNQIVEGFALRKYKAEYLHYLYRSYGSCEESIEHITYLCETESLSDKVLAQELLEEYTKLSKMLFRFIQSVEESHATPAFIREPHSKYDVSSDLIPESRILNPESL